MEVGDPESTFRKKLSDTEFIFRFAGNKNIHRLQNSLCVMCGGVVCRWCVSSALAIQSVLVQLVVNASRSYATETRGL